MKKLFTLLCVFGLISGNIFAQTSPNWKYLRTSNTGMGGDYLQCIEVDDCGNKWTGGYLPFWSQGSVARFNDTTWTNWSNFEGYVPADRIYDVAFDSNGDLWVAGNGVGNGVAHGGISHYDGTTWSSYTSANTPMPYDDMRGIVVDHNNVVWATYRDVTVSSGGGVVKFDGTTWTVYNPGNSGLQSTEVDKIDVDAQNNIWIGTNLGLVKFDGLNWILYNMVNSGLMNNDVTDVEYDASTGKIYAATGISIDIFDGTNWSHINHNNSPVSTTGLFAVDARGDSVIISTVGGSYLTYIFDGTNWITHQELDHTYDARIDHEGNFWICGIGVLEKYDGVNWTTYSVMNTGLPSMMNNDLYIDSKNIAWFGSAGNGGISRFDCPNWQSYNPYNFNLWPQPINYTGSGTGITEDIYGDIWMLFAGVAGGVVQVDNGDVNNPNAWHVWDNNNSGVSLQFLNGVAADQFGNVWVGYDGACSVSRYNHSTNSWTNYNLFQLGQITCGAGSGIESIRVDDSNNVWVCGLSGLAKFDQTNWTFYSYLNTPMLQGLVYDIDFDSQGNKWIATSSGLYKFDGVNWTTYNSTNTPMFGDNVDAVVIDNSGTVWLAAGSETFPYPSGLFSFDGTNWNTYTTTNSGLPEKYVTQLSLDTLGNIWLLTQSMGAAIFNPNGVIGYECIDKSLQTCVTTGVHTLSSDDEALLSVQPNPATAVTTIRVNLKGINFVTITITDVQGREIDDVFKGNLSEGVNEMQVDLSEYTQGVYFCKLNSGNKISTVKIVKM